METVLKWLDFKAFITSKLLVFQYQESAQIYEIFAYDGGVLYKTFIVKDADNCNIIGVDTVLEKASQLDFETNYKSLANKPIEQKSDSSSPMRVTPSPQPAGTTTYWDGENGRFTIADGTLSAYAEFYYAYPIFLKGGEVFCEDAVFGDYITAEIMVYMGGNWVTYSKYLNKVSVYKGIPKKFEAEDCSKLIPAGLRVRITYIKATVADQRRVSTEIKVYKY